MSLGICTNRIVAVYALNQWHSVKKGSFVIDAYELIDDPYSWEYKEHLTCYLLGLAYPEIRHFNQGGADGGTTFRNPLGSDGCQWVDEATGHITFMSLLEIKAWRQNKDEESI
jgi:hypothetical protein